MTHVKRTIKVATSGVLAQYEWQQVSEEEKREGRGFLHQVRDEALPTQFVTAYPRRRGQNVVARSRFIEDQASRRVAV